MKDAGCSSSSPEGEAEQPPPVADTCASVPSFQTEIYPSLQEHCSPCHAAGKPQVIQFLLSDMNVRAQRFDLRTLIEAGKMPSTPDAAPLTAETVAKFSVWVDCGAP